VVQSPIKHSLRAEIVIVLLGLLVAGCERPDSKLHTKLIGTWTQGDSFEMTFAPEGRCESKFVGKDKGATFTGNWFVSNSWLVVTVTGKSERNMTNAVHIGQVTHFSILSLDADRLVTAADGQTSTYNRK
jgi:hypothetical protein